MTIKAPTFGQVRDEQELYRYLSDLARGILNLPKPEVPVIPHIPSFAEIRDALEVGGAAPLVLTGLTGLTSEQTAKLLVAPTAPNASGYEAQSLLATTDTSLNSTPLQYRASSNPAGWTPLPFVTTNSDQDSTVLTGKKTWLNDQTFLASVLAYGGTNASVAVPAIGLLNNKIISWKDAAGGFTNCAFLWTDATNNLILGAGNSSRAWIAPTGEVGIGATGLAGIQETVSFTNSNTAQTITTGGYQGLIVANTNAGVNTKAGIGFTCKSSIGSIIAAIWARMTDATTGATDLHFSTYNGSGWNDPAMSINSLGNVGMGQIPLVRLHVGAGGAGATVEELRIDGGSGANGRPQISFTRNAVVKSYIGVSGGANNIITGDVANELGITSTTAINFSANNGSTIHMVVDTTGNIIINRAATRSYTPTQGALFDIAGALTKGNTLASWNLNVFDSRTMAQGVGGGILFSGYGTAQTGANVFGSIEGQKTNGTGGNISGDLVLKSATSAGVLTEGLRIDTKQNVSIGTAALATTATDGFLYIESCAGAPTGVPTTVTGRVATIYDTTNNNFYIYNGAWKKVLLA